MDLRKPTPHVIYTEFTGFTVHRRAVRHVEIILGGVKCGPLYNILENQFSTSIMFVGAHYSIMAHKEPNTHTALPTR